MLDAFELSGDDSGWAHLGTFGSYYTKLQPDSHALSVYHSKNHPKRRVVSPNRTSVAVGPRIASIDR